jgi:2-iminoacetate synthase
MIIDFEEIEELVESTEGGDSRLRAESALEKGALAKGLTLAEAAALLRVEDPELLEALYRTAAIVKERLYGRRVVLFAPLYLSNHCTNACLYCGFRAPNKAVLRNALTPDSVATEARALESMGFKRILLVTGEDPRWGLDYIIESVRRVYADTGIRIVHVNGPPMNVGDFKRLKAAGVGVYQAFQETYHRPTYELMHPAGRKSDFDFRLDVMDRALSAGFADVGIGPLLGLYDYKFDTLASIAHSIHLFEKFSAHAHTISVPRLRPAANSALTGPGSPVTDTDLKKIVAVLRLAVPTAGVVVSTREGAQLRTELLHTGASQLSAASKTGPGGYSKTGPDGAEKTLEQFQVNDERPLPEVMASIAKEGLVPSLCTTCYRRGRTGADFFNHTIDGEMEKLCNANAILTLKEYMLAHAGNGLNEDGLEALLDGAIKSSIDSIADPEMKQAVLEKLKQVEGGQKDLYF